MVDCGFIFSGKVMIYKKSIKTTTYEIHLHREASRLGALRQAVRVAKGNAAASANDTRALCSAAYNLPFGRCHACHQEGSDV
jgi:hypothetical protein